LENAVRAGLIPVSPAAAVAKPKAPEIPITPFTPEEVGRIQEAARGHRLAALFALAVATGAREGELFALGREHLDLEAGAITIRRSLALVKHGFIFKEPKSKRGTRIVDLPRFAVEALREHLKMLLAEGNAGAATIFCTGTGHYLSRGSFTYQVYKPVLKRAKVPYRKFHTFRHTHVSELLKRGESVVDVARRVGDKPEVILKTYAHFLPGGGANITSRLDSLYDRPAESGKAGKIPEGGVKVERA
jgi:integrase